MPIGSGRVVVKGSPEIRCFDQFWQPILLRFFDFI